MTSNSRSGTAAFHPAAFYLAWHSVGFLATVLLPATVALERPIWSVASPHLELAIGFAVGYAVAATIVGAWSWWFQPPDFRLALVVSFGTLLLVFTPLLLLHELQYSRSLLAIGSLLIGGYLPLPYLVQNFEKALIGIAGVMAVGSIGLTLGRTQYAGAEGPTPRIAVEFTGTTHHVVRSIRYLDYLPPPNRKVLGGGVDVLDKNDDGEHFLLVRPDGTLYRLRWRGDSLSVEPLEVVVPINASEFAADVDSTVQRQYFRVTDVLVAQRADEGRIFVAHHYWNSNRRCSVIRLSRLRASASDLISPGPVNDEWETVYETQPCLPIQSGSMAPFAGQQAGGQLAEMDRSNILMTVGHHQTTIEEPETFHPQTPDSDYGKTLLVDVDSREARHFSTGHRNPQGVFIDSTHGDIWLTEHGPKGGDELNRLVPGGNYGWPYHSYGAAYTALDWPLQGKRDIRDAVRPIFAWLPSIGISSIVSVRDSAFSRWEGDLLVTSLKDQSIWRTKIEGDRVVFTERISVGFRIRDIVQGSDGEFVLWSDSGALIRIGPAEGREAGVVLYQQYCAECHLLGQEARIGPGLSNVVGREVASVEGYQYSDALDELERRWTEERLHSFLAAPQSYAPGTTMAFEGIEDRAIRAKIIRYLKTFE